VWRFLEAVLYMFGRASHERGIPTAQRGSDDKAMPISCVAALLAIAIITGKINMFRIFILSFVMALKDQFWKECLGCGISTAGFQPCGFYNGSSVG
jgi:hypothetical protein